MGAKRVGLTELEQIRRRRKKTLARIALEAGMTVCAVWRVMRRKSFDLRQIAKVARAIGVPPRRLNLESFLGGQPEMQSEGESGYGHPTQSTAQ